MKWKFVLIIFSIILICCISHNESIVFYENKTHIVFTDDFGFVVSVKKYPKRIVSLAPSNTEILFALGLKDRIVGVTDYCNYPPDVLELKRSKRIESVGGYSTVDVEKVVRLRPDLVVASYGNGIGVVKALKSFGITVICLNPKSIEDIIRDIEILGKVCGVEENASKLVEWIKLRIELIREDEHNWKPRIVHIVWSDPIWVSGKNTFIDDAIEIAGGVNAVNESGWVVLSLEDLIRINPDIIIVNSGNGMSSSGENIIYESIIESDVLRNLKAVKCGNVYVIDADVISRPSYRLVYAIEEISKIIDIAYERERICVSS